MNYTGWNTYGICLDCKGGEDTPRGADPCETCDGTGCDPVPIAARLELKAARALRIAIGTHQLAVAGGLSAETASHRIGQALFDYDQVTGYREDAHKP